MSDRDVMHLRYCMLESCKNGIKDHPQKVMQYLGITYQHATPQSMGDQWWFWNCENVPEPLPKYLSILEADPLEMVGWGLSSEDAKKIIEYKK